MSPQTLSLRPPTSSNKREKGLRGEELAVEFLRSKGYRILARNVRFGKKGEIDIIAEDGDLLVFVEVKTRKSAFFGPPEEAVTPGKLAQVERLAQLYMRNNKIDRKIRFDVVAITLQGEKAEYRHIENAFY